MESCIIESTHGMNQATIPFRNTYAARHNFLMEHAAANTDWFDLLFTNSIMNEHTLSVSSGSQKSKSYISLGFLKIRDGLLPTK